MKEKGGYAATNGCLLRLVLASLFLAGCSFEQKAENFKDAPFDLLLNDYIGWQLSPQSRQVLIPYPVATTEEIQARTQKLSTKELALLNLKIALILPLEGEHALKFRQGQFCDTRRREVAKILANIPDGELMELCNFLQVPKQRASFLRTCISDWQK